MVYCSIYLKASFHDFLCTFILFFVFRGEFQLAKEEDIVEKVFFLKRNSAIHAWSLHNFNGVWLKLS